MKQIVYIVMTIILTNMSCVTQTGKTDNADPSCEVRLVTLDPGHFHAALVQKTSYPLVCKDVYVYAPEGDDFQEHMKRIEDYNTRAESPAQWNEIVYTGSDFLQKDVRNDILYVYSNGDITYKIKNIYAKVSVIWNYTFPEGDTHYSIMKGSKSHLIIEQGKEQGFKPQLTIKVVHGTDLTTFENELIDAIKAILSKYPGISITKQEEGRWTVEIPEVYHNGHETHFGQVTENFLQYLSEGALPDWEVPNMITKYHITTHALEMVKNKRP